MEKAKSVLAEHPRISFAYLFGSATKNKLNKHSDIDIAVFISSFCVDRKSDLDYLLRLKVELENKLGRPVDLAVLNVAAPLLKKEVLVSGSKIWDRGDGTSRQFRLRTPWEYDDIRPYLDYQYNKALEALREDRTNTW